MKIFWKVLRHLLAIFFVYAGIQHFVKPEFYEPFVPYFLPNKMAWVYVSGAFEILFGMCLLISRFSRIGAAGILCLLIAFLPVLILDVFSETPVIGSKRIAYIRLFVQFVFIGWAYGVLKRTKT